RQTDCLNRALLPDEAGHLFKFATQRERQVGGRAAMVEERRRQRSSEGKSRVVGTSCRCRISVTATVLRRCVRHCRIPPFALYLLTSLESCLRPAWATINRLSPQAKGIPSGQLTEPER